MSNRQNAKAWYLEQGSVPVELCKSNSVGDHYRDPTVVEYWSVATPAEALEECCKVRPNGFFVRVMEYEL